MKIGTMSKKAPVGERTLEVLHKERKEWREVRDNASKELRRICEEEAAIELAPFVIGQDVMCEVPAGRYKSLQKCRLSIRVNDSLDYYTTYVTPYKKDGTLGNRSFQLYGDMKETLERVK